MQFPRTFVSPQRNQRGITFIGILLIAIVVGFLFIVAAKTVPSLTEFQAVKSAVNRASDQQTVADVERAFNASAAIDDIKSISGKDLEVTKEDGRVVIRFAYDKEIPLVGPVSLLIHFKGQSKGTGS